MMQKKKNLLKTKTETTIIGSQIAELWTSIRRANYFQYLIQHIKTNIQTQQKKYTQRITHYLIKRKKKHLQKQNNITKSSKLNNK